MRIVFMGTPDFAVDSLKALIDAGHEIIGVFTQPDKRRGRGQRLLPPPIKELALKNNIPVYQPGSLRNTESFETLKMLMPEVIVVVAYGKLLPVNILNLPKFGCINVHGSLLPKYRGAAPIQWSVLNGDKTTGITTMFMAEGMDTGDILLKCETPIGQNETATELQVRLAAMGAQLLVETLDKLDTIMPIKQDDSLASRAPLLTKELSEIDFTLNSTRVNNLICGLSEWPCAQTIINGKRLKIYKSRLAPDCSCSPFEILDSKAFIVGCGENTAIEFMEVQFDNGKRMRGIDFLRGHQQNIGDFIGKNTIENY